jgi:hypothetical protein
MPRLAKNTVQDQSAIQPDALNAGTGERIACGHIDLIRPVRDINFPSASPTARAEHCERLITRIDRNTGRTGRTGNNLSRLPSFPPVSQSVSAIAEQSAAICNISGWDRDAGRLEIDVSLKAAVEKAAAFEGFDLCSFHNGYVPPR